MKTCPRCNHVVGDFDQVCPECRYQFPPVGDPNMQHRYDNGRPNYPAPMPMDPFDHTYEFSPRDVSKNKAFALAGYLFGILGIIAALIFGKDSPYLAFHMHQAIKISVTRSLMVLVSLLFIWTGLVPLAAFIGNIILYVVQLICIFRTCGGTSKEVPILKNFDFLK